MESEFWNTKIAISSNDSLRNLGRNNNKKKYEIIKEGT